MNFRSHKKNCNARKSETFLGFFKFKLNCGHEKDGNDFYFPALQINPFLDKSQTRKKRKNYKREVNSKDNLTHCNVNKH